MSRLNNKTILAMITKSQITEIFYELHEFYTVFSAELQNRSLEGTLKKRRYKKRIPTLSIPEVMMIIVMYHMSSYKCLKHFYLQEICERRRDLFPNVVSYNRFTEIEAQAIFPLFAFLKQYMSDKCTGVSIVDSTPLRVCRNQRILQHKVFDGLAERGHCSMGWFFGFKLHLICNEKGELVNFTLTKGNVDDREPLKDKSFIYNLFGKLVGDKGYISKDLFDKLFVDGIQLITKLKKNMKGCTMSIGDTLLLRKRALIETVNDELKSIANVEHSRHRSVANFIANTFSALTAYCFFPKKPSFRMAYSYYHDDRQLTLF